NCASSALPYPRRPFTAVASRLKRNDQTDHRDRLTVRESVDRLGVRTDPRDCPPARSGVQVD
ncbi:MAG: hypothetical protein WBI31_04360, partial [Thermacetogeniaceae bacterium]